ncbi:MAG: mevalonate kinase [Patescibacteria group bacterium]|nr:MAG: mevalonate kinase [Patescibacteria group bacterium]
MKQICYSAPAKIILSGEHSVVYGKPALATAIDKRIKIKLTSAVYSSTSCRPKHWQSMEDFVRKYLKLSDKFPDYNVDIYSEIPQGSGLGSSAAYSVASIACLLHLFTKKPASAELVNKLAFQAEKIFHKNPSGIDNSTSTFGGFIFYRKEFEFLKLVSRLSIKIPNNFQERMFLIDTGKPKESTAEMVEFVGKLWNQKGSQVEKTVNDIEKTTKRLVISLVQENFKFFCNSIAENQRLLESLGVFSDYSKNLLSQISEYGVYKLVGAGGRAKGSGYVLFVASDNGFDQVLEKNNFKFFPYKFSNKGLIYENSG